LSSQRTQLESNSSSLNAKTKGSSDAINTISSSVNDLIETLLVTSNKKDETKSKKLREKLGNYVTSLGN
jgi:hypothetical protein